MSTIIVNYFNIIAKNDNKTTESQQQEAVRRFPL